MPLKLDPQVASAIAALGNAGYAAEPVARGDWASLRSSRERMLSLRESRLPECTSVRREDLNAVSLDGARVRVRWYAPRDLNENHPGPAVLYLHGGGMILASVELYDRYVARYVAESGVPMLSVDYRRAPENPHPIPSEDVFAALAWLVSHAEQMAVDPERVAIMGDSGGGGLAAAVAIMARDRGIPLARQILVYPMLDDRNTTPDDFLEPFARWSYDDNYTGWQALLGESIGTADVSSSAAPAREANLTNLADTYIEVGEVDIFRDECIEYAQRLLLAGSSVELHVHRGCPHGFDSLAPASDVALRARADRLRVIRQV